MRMNPDGPAALLLASASPRRRRLLAWLGLPFDVAAFETPERLDSPLASNPPALAEHLAKEKVFAARDALPGDPRLVLCFDTIVVLDGAVLGKPDDLEDAWRMLQALSGRTHQVVTGVALDCPGEDAAAFSVVTDVRMKELRDESIERWMARGEFMGCAGAYNIEGQVAEVDATGCYQNVAGLPLCHLYAALKAMRPPCSAGSPTSPIATCDAALGRTCALGPQAAVGT
ncbi:MAG: Maf family protein [Actinomycetota bacterium]|nr:Maf family protein [Actinomycetota bacterium]